jgi:hypothetical protein
MSKIKEKERAIILRRKGFTYSEILKEIPVAKSSLSLWLRGVGLAKKQEQRLTKKREEAQRKGAQARRNYRLVITRDIKDRARKEVGKISSRELWLIGTALYWAEGHKERRFGTLLRFGNSDVNMVKVYLKWLKVCGVSKKNTHFRIYLHENAKNKVKKVQRYWARNTGFSVRYFQKITWKKNKVRTNRKNIGDNYYGLVDVIVKKSVNLNRRTQGWVEGIYYCGVV